MRSSSILSWLSATVLGLALVGCGGGSDSVETSQAPNATACTKTNPKVGQVANLSTLQHAVSGQAVVVDDCTIEIRNFTYDGGGLSLVQAYGAVNQQFQQGFGIGPNLKGTAYNGQTLTLKLAAGDLDKMNSLSIWCDDASASFGDGVFAAR